MKPPAPYPKPHRYDFRTLKRAAILFTEPERGQYIEQEDVGCESPGLRNAIRAAREAFDAAMERESKPSRIPSAQSPQPSKEKP